MSILTGSLGMAVVGPPNPDTFTEIPMTHIDVLWDICYNMFHIKKLCFS